ncbi:MAG TPA: hypothetical protein VIM68_06375 [Thermoanaerobaculia bacterium]|jgi:hypothetical protein
MRGVIMGGWSYVVAAYSLTTAMLIAYAISLLIRLSEARGPRPEAR